MVQTDLIRTGYFERPPLRYRPTPPTTGNPNWISRKTLRRQRKRLTSSQIKQCKRWDRSDRRAEYFQEVEARRIRDRKERQEREAREREERRQHDIPESGILKISSSQPCLFEFFTVQTVNDSRTEHGEIETKDTTKLGNKDNSNPVSSIDDELNMETLVFCVGNAALDVTIDGNDHDVSPPKQDHGMKAEELTLNNCFDNVFKIDADSSSIGHNPSIIDRHSRVEKEPPDMLAVFDFITDKCIHDVNADHYLWEYRSSLKQLSLFSYFLFPIPEEICINIEEKDFYIICQETSLKPVISQESVEDVLAIISTQVLKEMEADDETLELSETDLLEIVI